MRRIDDERMPAFDMAREALVDARDASALKAPLAVSATAPPVVATAAPTAAGGVRITSYADNVVTLAVDAPVPGVVVLHDLAYPGWTVAVDGTPAPLLRANILFRGVEVPAGAQTVRFTFDPLSFANLTAAASGLLHRGAR